MMLSITILEARIFILSKQGLLGKHRFIGKDGAYQYVRSAGCIQYDPVDVCGKNAELTLQSRVKGFKKKALADLLYQDRLLVDYSDKELAIWPREDWPYFAGYRQRSREHGQSFLGIPELEKELKESGMNFCFNPKELVFDNSYGYGKWGNGHFNRAGVTVVSNKIALLLKNVVNGKTGEIIQQ